MLDPDPDEMNSDPQPLPVGGAVGVGAMEAPAAPLPLYQPSALHAVVPGALPPAQRHRLLPCTKCRFRVRINIKGIVSRDE